MRAGDIVGLPNEDYIDRPVVLNQRQSAPHPSKATAQAGAGGENGPSIYPPIDPAGYGGTAQAYATGVALTGNVQANASAYGGWALVPGTAAVAHSDAKNSKGEVLTTASAPRDAGGGSPSAVTSAGVGAGSIILSPSESQVVSDAILTLSPISHTNLETIGEGAMSAGFSGGTLAADIRGNRSF